MIEKATVEAGSKVHIVTRRQFENDLRRHFAGEVVDVGSTTMLVEGYAFIMESGVKYVRRPNLRTRIFSLIDSSNIINVLPKETNLENLSYQIEDRKRLVVTDGENFMLDINEFGTVL